MTNVCSYNHTGCRIECQLSFQDLSGTGASVQTLQAGMDDFSEGPVTGSIPYLETEMATNVYVSQNRVI